MLGFASPFVRNWTDGIACSQRVSIFRILHLRQKALGHEPVRRQTFPDGSVQDVYDEFIDYHCWFYPVRVRNHPIYVRSSGTFHHYTALPWRVETDIFNTDRALRQAGIVDGVVGIPSNVFVSTATVINGFQGKDNWHVAVRCRSFTRKASLVLDLSSLDPDAQLQINPGKLRAKLIVPVGEPERPLELTQYPDRRVFKCEAAGLSKDSLLHIGFELDASDDSVRAQPPADAVRRARTSRRRSGSTPPRQ